MKPHSQMARFHSKKNVTWKTRTDIIGYKYNNPDISYLNIAERFGLTEGIVKSTLTPLINFGILSHDYLPTVEGNGAWESYLESGRVPT